MAEPKEGLLGPKTIASITAAIVAIIGALGFAGGGAMVGSTQADANAAMSAAIATHAPELIRKLISEDKKIFSSEDVEAKLQTRGIQIDNEFRFGSIEGDVSDLTTELARQGDVQKAMVTTLGAIAADVRHMKENSQ